MHRAPLCNENERRLVSQSCRSARPSEREPFHVPRGDNKLENAAVR